MSSDRGGRYESSASRYNRIQGASRSLAKLHLADNPREASAQLLPPVEASERERTRQVSFTASANRGAGADGPWRRIRSRMLRGARIRLGGAAAASGAMAAAVVLTLAASAGASTSRADILASAA